MAKGKGGGKHGVKKSADDLSIKEQIFVREYLKDENGTRSAIAAGYAKGSATVTASRMLRKANIQAALANVTKRLCDNLEITDERVLREVARLAFYDPRKLFDANGRIKPITELDDDTAMAIAGIETAHKVVGDQADGMVVFTKIKLTDKRSACELLGRKLKLWTDKVEHGGRLTLEQLLCGE